MNSDECLMQYDITTRAGHAEIPPSREASASILEAVERSNRGARLAGLPDELNPVVIDPSKVQAFLSGLPKLSDESLKKLRGRTLYLNDPALLLHSASPVTVDALRSGFQLAVPEGAASRIAPAHMIVPIDFTLARERATSAKQMMETFDDEVVSLEKKHRKESIDGKEEADLLKALSNTRAKRYSTATVWRDLTAALARKEPKNKALQAEAQAAKKTAARFIVAPWTGMPN